MTLLRYIASTIPLQPLPRRKVPAYPRIARARKLRIAGITEVGRLRVRDLHASFGACDIAVIRARRAGLA